MSQTDAATMEMHSATGLPNRKVLMWTFIGSECLFFATLISTYMVYKGRSVVGPYPEEILDIPLTTISTFVLLMSSLAMVLALDGVQKGKRAGQFWLLMVILLGITFLGFQVYEFSHFVHVGLTIQQNVFGSSFFVLTGFHGTHVAIGVIMLLSLWGISRRQGSLSERHGLNLELVGLYWHFVDIIWIVIFTVVYLLSTPS